MVSNKRQVPVKISAQNHTEPKKVENNTLFVLKLFIQDIFVIEQETLHPCSRCAWLLLIFLIFFLLFNNTCC